MSLEIHLVGAFDRFNFGDLLFAQVTRHGLAVHGVSAEYRYHSLESADLSRRGGVVTKPLRELSQRGARPGSVVMVAGGEVLAARWSDALCGLTSPGRCLLLKVVTRLFGADMTDGISRRRLAGTRPMPWVLPPERFGPDVRLVYNAVGGSGLGGLPGSLQTWARQQLKTCHHLSVRDRASQAILESWHLGHEVLLAPDSAALVAEMAPREQLPAHRAARGDHLVFQVGRYPAWGILGELALQLRRLHEATGLAILLVPLGQAAGHEDHVPLRRLATRLGDLPVTLVERPGVEELLTLIASARLFVGSSLHGNLTALAYGVPRVGFGRRVRKLHAFLETWDPSQPEGCCPVQEIAARAQDALQADPRLNAAIADELAAAASGNFSRIAEIVLG